MLARKLSGWLAVAAIFWLYIFGIDKLDDWLNAKWAIATPPLVGEWVGTLRAGNGTPRAVWLSLRRRRRSGRRRRCRGCDTMEGSGALCDARGEVVDYGVRGRPDRMGGKMHLAAKPAVEPPPDGLELSTLDGRWDGNSTLDFKADFFWRKGKSAISSTEDPATQPVPLHMERGNRLAFEVLCRQLRGKAR